MAEEIYPVLRYGIVCKPPSKFTTDDADKIAEEFDKNGWQLIEEAWSVCFEKLKTDKDIINYSIEKERRDNTHVEGTITYSPLIKIIILLGEKVVNLHVTTSATVCSAPNKCKVWSRFSIDEDPNYPAESIDYLEFYNKTSYLAPILLDEIILVYNKILCKQGYARDQNGLKKLHTIEIKTNAIKESSLNPLFFEAEKEEDFSIDKKIESSTKCYDLLCAHFYTLYGRPFLNRNDYIKKSKSELKWVFYKTVENKSFYSILHDKKRKRSIYVGTIYSPEGNVPARKISRSLLLNISSYL